MRKFNPALVISLVALVLFTFLGWRNLDPDFGWHYQMGKIITTTGIPPTDPFTYTMPSYPFVDYEWGSNILIYEIYTHFGKFVLAFLYAACAVIAVHIAIPKSLKKNATLLLILAFAALTSIVGIRPQVEGWLFIAILVRILFEKQIWEKWRWTFPLLMLIWANFHGSYPIAFIILGSVKFGEFIQTRKFSLKDVTICVLGLLATLLNPYGIHNWIEILKQMSQSSLFRRTIAEWRPFYTHASLGFLFMLVLTFLFIWHYKRKISWGWTLVCVVTAVMAMSSLRHIPIFILMALPVTYSSLASLYNSTKKIPFGPERFRLLRKVFCGVALIIFLGEIVLALANNFSEETRYPVAAVSYLQNSKLQGRIFNIYDYGGYLIWKLPEQKVFIDGRTPGFEWDAPQGESKNVYLEYLNVKGEGENWQAVFTNYNIKYVLWPNAKPVPPEENEFKESIAEFVNKWLIGWGGNMYEAKTPLVERLKNTGWTELYKDDRVIILQRPE